MKLKFLEKNWMVILLLMVSACTTSKKYIITLRDGRQFMSEDQPKFQDKTGYFRYKNPQNRSALLRADEVLSIEEGA
jgi:protein-tyrosine phosphatase